MKELCPICKNELNVKCYYGDIWIEEEHKDCPCCNYSYEYAYGSYKESFGRYEFIWHYTDIFNPAYDKKYKRALFMARRNWHKGIRKNLKRGAKENESKNFKFV